MSYSIFHEMTTSKTYQTISGKMIWEFVTVTKILFSISEYAAAYLILFSFLIPSISQAQA